MGQLVSSDVLPKVAKELRKSALAGGAFELALKGLQVTEGKFITQSQRAGDEIFKSGFAEGLSELYQTLSDELASTGKSQKDLGNIYKNFFKVITKSVKALTPFIEAAIQILSKLTDGVALSYKGWKLLYAEFVKMPPVLQNVALGVTAVGLAMNSVVAKGLVFLGIFQEIASLFDDKLVGVLEAELGTQFNFKDMTQQSLRHDKKTNKFFAEGEKTGMLTTDVGKGVAAFGGLATLAASIYTLQKVVLAFSTATSLAAKVMGVVGGVSSVSDIDVDGKEKTKGKPPKGKSWFSKIGKTELVAATVVASNYAASLFKKSPWVAAVAQQSSADTSKEAAAFNINRLKSELTTLDPTSSEFARKRDAITNINNQMATGNIMQGLDLFKVRPDSPTIKVEGFEINVNLADGNLQQAQQAGEMLGQSFIEKLNSGLSAAIKGGR